MNTADQSAGTPVVYTGFARRLGAYVIDNMILAFGVGISVAVLAGSKLLPKDSEGGVIMLVVLLVYWLYAALLESSPNQATVGKLALDIKVTDLAGNRISFWRATGRFFAEILSSLTLLIGYIMAAFTGRKQALHDKIAGTLVVPKDEAAAREAATPTSGWLIALVIVGCFVPVFGILAAIAIPAYQDYTIRAQVTEGLNMSSAYKAAVAEAWSTTPMELEQIDTASVGSELGGAGKYVESIQIHSGIVLITYGNQAHPKLKGHVLSMVPALNDDNALAWACGYGEGPEGFEVAFDDHRSFTDMPMKFLPSACRENGRSQGRPVPAYVEPETEEEGAAVTDAA